MLQQPGEYDITVTPVRKAVRPILFPAIQLDSGIFCKQRYVCGRCGESLTACVSRCPVCETEWGEIIPIDEVRRAVEGMGE